MSIAPSRRAPETERPQTAYERLSGEFSFVRLNKADLPEHAELLEEVFGTTSPRELVLQKSWGWQEPDQFMVFGVRAPDGTLAGSISYFPRTFIRGEEVMQCVEAGDGMISRRFRGQSLFLALIAFSLKQLHHAGLKVVYGFPNTSAYATWCKSGVSFPYAIRTALLPLLPASVLARKFPLPGPLITVIDKIYAGARSWRRSPARVQIKVRFGAPAEMAQISTVTFPSRFERSRSAEYFKWRYSWNTREKDRFRTLLVSRGGRRLAYIILRLTDDGAAEIFEVGCSQPEDVYVCIAALSTQGVDALQENSRTPINRMVFVDCSGTEPLCSALASSGFMFRRTPYFLMMHAIDATCSRYVDARNWHITLADTDWV